MKENDIEACYCLPPSGQLTWRQWFRRREDAPDSATTLSGRVAENLGRTGKTQLNSVDSMLSKVRRGRSAGLAWALADDQRTTAIEAAMGVPPGTLRSQFERLQRAEREEVRWRLENPPVLALPLNASEPRQQPSQARRDRRPPTRRRISLDVWLAELVTLREREPDASIEISVNGPGGSGRAWIAAKLQREDLDVGIDAFEADVAPTKDSPTRRVVLETTPWGPDDVEALVSESPKEQRERVEQHLVAPWRKAPRALPEELRRPVRLFTLVERAQKERVSIEPLDVRRVELELRVGEIRERVAEGAVADVRRLLDELARWWIGAGPGSMAADAALGDVLAAIAAKQIEPAIPRGAIPTADLFAALEGDEGKRKALLSQLAEHAEAPAIVDALIEAGVLVLRADRIAWTEDGRATARLLLAAGLDVDAPALTGLVWTEMDRRLVADAAVFHGRGARELVDALDHHRGRARVGVYLAALELALALGPERVPAEELEEAWLGALYGVALDAVPGFEWETAERLLMEVSRVFRDVLPRFESEAHGALAHRVDEAFCRELAMIGPWDDGRARFALPLLCVWQLATSELAEHLKDLHDLAVQASDVLLARARTGEADAIGLVVDRFNLFEGDRPSPRDVAEWCRDTKLSRETLSVVTQQALNQHRNKPDDEALGDQLAAWLARWPRTEVEAALLECVFELDLSRLGLEDRFAFEHVTPVFAALVPGTEQRPSLSPDVALQLLERLGSVTALREVVVLLAAPDVLRMRLQRARPSEGAASPLDRLLRLRHQALLALTRLGDLELPRAEIARGTLQIDDEMLGREFCLWGVLAEKYSGVRERIFGDADAWSALYDGLRQRSGPDADVFVRAMTVADDHFMRQRLWPQIAYWIWAEREALWGAVPAGWRMHLPIAEPSEHDDERWRALLDRGDEQTLARWLDQKVTDGHASVPALGAERLAQPAFREALWRAAGRGKARREVVFEALRSRRHELDLERGWLARAQHTFGEVPRWLSESYRTEEERRRDRAAAELAAGVLNPLQELQLTLVAEGKWTEAARALITPAARTIAVAEPESAFSIGDALFTIRREYDDDALAPVYLAAYRWVKEATKRPEPDPHLGMIERDWLAERCYRLGVLGHEELEPEDRRGYIEEIALENEVSSAPLDALWSKLSELSWGRTGNAALARLEAELGDRFAAEGLERAAAVEAWDGIWAGVVEASFFTMPESWAPKLNALAVWRSDAARAFGVLNRCVWRLGPAHPSFARLNAQLEDLAREHLVPSGKERGDEPAVVGSGPAVVATAETRSTR